MFRLHRLWLSLRQPRTQYFGTDAGTRGKGESLRNSMGDRKTWDNIYSKNSHNGFSHFDWFFGYEQLKGRLLALINEIALDEHTGSPIGVLDLGCGTSDVGVGLFRDSRLPLLISCVDNSAPAIHAMRKSLLETPIVPAHQDSQLEYLESDVTQLHGFLSGSVSLILDKGTSDSLLRSGREQAQKMVLEALRVLKKGGKLVQFTDEDPDARLPFLEKEIRAQPNVTFHDLALNDGVTYYAYIVTRVS